MVEERSGRVAGAVLVAVLVLGAAVPAGVAATATPDESPVRSVDTGGERVSSPTPGAVGANPAATRTAARPIELTTVLALTPERPGEVTVTLRFSMPSTLDRLATRVPSNATVTDVDGFDERDDRVYRWDERTDEASITYRLDANRTRDVEGPLAGSGAYSFVDVGEWALVRVPETPTAWDYDGRRTGSLSRSTTTAGPGAAGDSIAFLGEHREVTRSAHGQRFRLVVPERATLAESPDDVLNATAAASDRLRVGDRDDEVFLVAAPTTSVRWSVLGLATGDADYWVRDSERLDRPANTWLHEYVHTRQDYRAAAEARWFTEATASYYAALLSLERGRVGYEPFRYRMARGAWEPDAKAVLTDPGTWTVRTPYTKGALVAGTVDRRIRLASDRDRSLDDVFRRLNGHDGRVTADVVRDAVRNAGGRQSEAVADRYLTTRDAPRPWNRSEHWPAFGPLPAHFTYDVAETGYRVRGPYRNGSLGAGRPLRLATGETLAVDVTVDNTGGTNGSYGVDLFVDGERRGRATSRLGPGERRTVTVEHRFTAPGNYTVTAGNGTDGAPVTVQVREPAPATVTALDASPDAGGQGTVAVRATVDGADAHPAAANLTLSRDGAAVEQRRVELAPGATRTVRFVVTDLPAGQHAFTVGNRTAQVTLDPTTTATGTAGTTGPTGTAGATRTTGDGFGPAVALAALATLAAVARRRTREDG